MAARPLTRRIAAGTALVAATGALVGVARNRPRPVHPTVRGRFGEVVTDDGTRLRVIRNGDPDADVVVVLVHGWAMSTGFWAEVAEDLAVDHLVVRYDQRGHGRSTDPGGDGATLEALGSDLGAVLASLPGEGPVILAGHSMGAMSILSWAHHDRTARDRVVGALLFNTGAHGLVEASASSYGAASRSIEPFLRAVITTPAPIGAMPPVSLRRLVAFAAHGPDADRRAVDRTVALVRASRPRVRSAFGQSMDTMDLRPAMRALDVPTLVVGSTHDGMTPLPLARSLAAGIPNARLEVAQGLGHQAPLEAPDLAAILVREHRDLVLWPEDASAA